MGVDGASRVLEDILTEAAAYLRLPESEERGRWDTHRNPRKCPAAGIGLSLDAGSRSCFVVQFNAQALGLQPMSFGPPSAPIPCCIHTQHQRPECGLEPSGNAQIHPPGLANTPGHGNL
jgi:hypothetical protein